MILQTVSLERAEWMFLTFFFWLLGLWTVWTPWDQLDRFLQVFQYVQMQAGWFIKFAQAGWDTGLYSLTFLANKKRLPWKYPCLIANNNGNKWVIFTLATGYGLLNMIGSHWMWLSFVSIYIPTIYHLVIQHNYGKSPFSSWVNHLFLWAMASMAMLVITRGHPYVEGISMTSPRASRSEGVTLQPSTRLTYVYDTSTAQGGEVSKIGK